MSYYGLSAIRLLSLVMGLAFVYVALFLYEDEQGKLQNHLENFWITIDDYRQSVLTRHTRFLQVNAMFASNLLDKLFGKRLLSLQTLATSSCYSIASLCLTVIWFPHQLVINEYGYSILFFITFLMILHLAVGTAPFFISHRLVKFWVPTAILSVSFTLLLFYLWEAHGWERVIEEFQHVISESGALPFFLGRHAFILQDVELMGLQHDSAFVITLFSGFYLGLVVGIISDVFFIVITRKLLRRSVWIENSFKTIALIVINCSLALLLLRGPIWFAHMMRDLLSHYMGSSRDLKPPERYLSPLISQAGFIGSQSNIITSLAAFLFVALAITMIAHRVLWPLLARPVYALQEVGIGRRKKLLLALGIALIAIWAGYVPELLKAIERFAP